MKLFINTEPLRNANAGRGVGQYTRMLIEAIKKYTNISLVESVATADVVHYPFYDLFFLTLPLLKSKPTVVTIHDVIPLLYPEQYPRGFRGAIKHSIQMLSLSGVRRIVTDSNCSTNDVVNLLKQPPQKVKTVYLAPDPMYMPASKERIDKLKDKYQIKKPYFLYVGDINYNKNLPALFLAFQHLSDRYELVLACRQLRRDNPASHYLWKLIDDLNIEKQIKIIGDIAAEDMPGLYSGAFWYIQPSLYEGFGLPVLEAQACECPVISTNGGSLFEICNESCLTFDLILIEDLNEIRNRFVELGTNNLMRFSWEKTASQMAEIYSQCAS